jgi:hypothetical protein
MYILFSVIVFIAVIAALVDIITRDESQVKHLPKIAWVLLVVFLPLIGTIIWFLVGHDYSYSVERGIRPSQPRHQRPDEGERFFPPPPGGGERSTEEQLADLEREIEYYRKRAEEGPDSSRAS